MAMMKPAQWQAVIDVNLSAVFYNCQVRGGQAVQLLGRWLCNSLAGSCAFSIPEPVSPMPAAISLGRVPVPDHS
jgi:hypothetical protein